MSIRKKPFVGEEYYHIYNRGNAKRIIFKNKEDYNYFLKILCLFNTKQNINIRDIPKDFSPTNPLVDIGAYCLMPNHFHFLIKESTKGGISKFMQKVSTGYVMYFNKKHAISGSLFEGKFKSQHIDSDRYLKYIYSYIHLNPLKLLDKNWKNNNLAKEKVIDFLKDYEYSSCKFYLSVEKIR